MKRLTNPVPQFLDNEGEILSGGSIGFYENGSTSIKKNTYNADGGAENLNPLPLTGEGRVPSCWGDGIYTLVLRAAPIAPLTDFEDGEIIWVRNGYEFGESAGQFGDWSPNERYDLNEIVRYIDGLYYLSESNGNIGNYPNVSGVNWSQIGFLRYWNADKDGGYLTDDIVIKSGKLYRSTVDDNETTPPSASWEDLTFNNSVTGDFEVGGEITSGGAPVAVVYSVIKTVSQNKNSTTTYSADSDLQLSGLPSGRYNLTGLILWTGNSSTSNGIKMRIGSAINISADYIVYTGTKNALPVSTSAVPALSATARSSSDSGIHLLPSSAGATDHIIINGYFEVALSGGGFTMHWAQETSTATDTTVLQYSSLTAIKVG